MSATRRFDLLSKKVIVVVILAAGSIAAILIVAPSISQATTAYQQQQERKMTWFGQGMPQINVSVSVADEASSFINENVKVPFVTAAQTAQGQITNGSVLGGHLGVVQGYLVYTFFLADTTNQTGHLNVIDAGNGEVLYMPEGQPLGSFGHLSTYGHFGGHGHEGWSGPWKGQQ